MQRQWMPTEMPRMRHAMVEHARGDLDRLAHPGVREYLRRAQVGPLSEFTKKPVTDDMFESELAVRHSGTWSGTATRNCSGSPGT